MTIQQEVTLAFDTRWDLDTFRLHLEKNARTVVVAHTNADGDAVGSVAGLCALLRSVAQHHHQEARVQGVLPDGVPDDLAWLPGADAILDGHQPAAAEALHEAELIVGVDISGLARTGCLEPLLRSSQVPRLLIDHHESPARDEFVAIISEPRASSTCELVYWLAHRLWGDQRITPEAATCLYAGISTDTGSFAYSNDRPSLYLAAANLICTGIDPAAIQRKIKNTFTESRMRFFGYAIAHRLVVYPERKVALMVLTAHDMSEAGVKSHELTGLINEVMRLRDVDCGILVREEEGRVRLSLRSKEEYDVDRMAREMFGGGGHKRAAGATSTVGLRETVDIIKQRLAIED